MTPAHRPVGDRLRAAGRFVRASALGATVELPVVGAATAGSVDLRALGVLITVGASFHVFAYVLNDVVDLPLDRTEPRRSISPLVTGAVLPGTALVVALVQVPLAMGLTVLAGGGLRALTAIVLALAAMACYDLWGKRMRVPLVTDVVQGLSWAALTAWGAFVVATPTPRTWLLCGFVVALMVLVNGVHGSLRDIDNDLRCGARTTAIVLGAEPTADGGVHVPRRLAAHAVLLQAVLVVTALAVLAIGPARPAGWWAMTHVGVVGALLVASCLLLLQASRVTASFWEFRYVGMLHVVCALLLPIALVAPHLGPGPLVLLLAAFGVPVASDRWSRPALTWLLRGGRRSRRTRPVQEVPR